jgi:hypothetical protein
MSGPRTGSKILVTGCGRSGTKFAALLLQRLGLDVRHEEMGRDGIAAWPLAVASTAAPPWGPAAAPDRFGEVYHQVRHPLQVIASAATFKPSSWEFVYAHTSASPADPVVLRGAKYWLEWNEHAERIATWRYRVEDVAAVFDELCGRLGVAADRRALERVPADCNTRRRGRAFHYYDEISTRLGLRRVAAVTSVLARPQQLPDVSWSDLERLDARLAERVRAKAAEYGYRA